MTRSDINIKIEGLPASGKSRILFIIKKMLESEGFIINHKVNVDYVNEDQFDERMFSNIDEIIEHFKETKSISIEGVTPNNNV